MDGVTPSGARIKAHIPYRDEVGTVDITTGVQALYDLVLNSMDWGSGFISLEDAIPVAELARVCGFEGIEEAERYVLEQRRKESIRAQRTREYEARVAELAAPTQD